MQRFYKFVYIWNYAINILIVLILLSNYWIALGPPMLKRWLEFGICSLGTSMFLFLWSRSFIVDNNYEGSYMLNARNTRLFTLSLLLIEWMTLYYSAFGHELFIRPATAGLIVWIIGFIAAIFTGKLIIPVKRINS